MNYRETLRRLLEAGALLPAEAEYVATAEAARPFSLHAELRMALYLGVTLLSGGLGVLIYQNLDSIGHQAIIAGLSVLMLGCFAYVWRQRQPYANGLVLAPSPLPDYLLLLGCLLFLSLEGYLQFAYNTFGTRYGLATVLPALLFLPLAYRFDHRGVLSMGLTALASWVGLAVAPFEVLGNASNLAQVGLVETALVFGIAVMAAALALERRGIKPHFTFTYLLLAGNLSFVAALVGWFQEGVPLVYLLVLAGLCTGFVWYARLRQSFFFLLMALVYGYVGFTYLLFRWMDGETMFWLGLYYFVFSCAGVVLFLFRYKRILGVPARAEV